MDYLDLMQELHQIITFDLDPNSRVAKTDTAKRLTETYNALLSDPHLYVPGTNKIITDDYDEREALVNVPSLEG